MAHLLGVENLRLTVGSRLLMDEVTLGLEDGTRVGVLAPTVPASPPSWRPWPVGTSPTAAASPAPAA